MPSNIVFDDFVVRIRLLEIDDLSLKVLFLVLRRDSGINKTRSWSLSLLLLFAKEQLFKLLAIIEPFATGHSNATEFAILCPSTQCRRVYLCYFSYTRCRHITLLIILCILHYYIFAPPTSNKKREMRETRAIVQQSFFGLFNIWAGVNKLSIRDKRFY